MLRKLVSQTKHPQLLKHLLDLLFKTNRSYIIHTRKVSLLIFLNCLFSDLLALSGDQWSVGVHGRNTPVSF